LLIVGTVWGKFHDLIHGWYETYDGVNWIAFLLDLFFDSLYLGAVGYLIRIIGGVMIWLSKKN
jgi:hypothetical protein